jgi:acyl carrier protein
LLRGGAGFAKLGHRQPETGLVATLAGLELTAIMDNKTKIKEYISKHILFSDQGFGYDDDASFLEQGIIDSIGFMELVAFVEKDYHIKVGPQELVPENFDSINKLSRFITSKMAGAVPAA